MLKNWIRGWIFVPEVKFGFHFPSFYFALIPSWFRLFTLGQMELCHFYTLLFLFMSKNIKKQHIIGTEKEWSFHSPFHLCKGFLPPFVRHCRWRKTKVALCSASSEGQTVKVGNPSSPSHSSTSSLHPWVEFLPLLPFFLAICCTTFRRRGKKRRHSWRKWRFTPHPPN